MSQLCPDPIVVLGAPRSGTTYLRQVLDSHPEVAMTNEHRVFEWLRRSLELCDDDQAVFEHRDRLRGWLTADLPRRLRAYYEEVAPDARWWGDKNPHYAAQPETVETLRTCYPGARLVHIVRDPGAVVASLLRKRNDDGSVWIAAEAAHTMVVGHVDNARRCVAEAGPQLGYELRYEDLVADDEGVARRLFAWLGVPFAPAVESFCRAQSRSRTAFSGPTTALSDAGAKAHEAWSEAVPAADQRQSLQFLAPLLLRHGYEDAASLDARNRALPDA